LFHITAGIVDARMFTGLEKCDKNAFVQVRVCFLALENFQDAALVYEQAIDPFQSRIQYIESQTF